MQYASMISDYTTKRRKLKFYRGVMILIKRWALVLSVVLCLGNVSYSTELKVLTEDYTPFNYLENGSLKGFTTEIVQTLIKKTGVQIERNKILLWPWKRAYQTALEEDNVLLFTTTRTPQREKLFKWVGPIYPREQWVFKLKSRDDINVDNIQEAMVYKVAEVEDSANYQAFVKHGFLPGKNLITLSKGDSKIKMFLAGRIDLVSYIPLEAAYRLRELGKSYDIMKKLFLMSGEYKYYLAFSYGTDDEIVEQFQKAFDDMKHGGHYEKILKKYMK